MLLVFAFVRITRFCRQRLLGRNLITVFSTVNNLSQFFSLWPARGGGVNGGDRGCRCACCTHRNRSSCYGIYVKALFLSAFAKHQAMHAIVHGNRSGSRAASTNARMRPDRPLKKNFRPGGFFASHNPICAKLRSRYSPAWASRSIDHRPPKGKNHSAKTTPAANAAGAEQLVSIDLSGLRLPAIRRKRRGRAGR